MVLLDTYAAPPVPPRKGHLAGSHSPATLAKLTDPASPSALGSRWFLAAACRLKKAAALLTATGSGMTVREATDISGTDGSPFFTIFFFETTADDGATRNAGRCSLLFDFASGGGGVKVTVGTFNLNNLFSRFNFSGAIEAIRSGGPAGGLTIRYEFTDPSTYRIRTFMGKLVKAKDAQDTGTVARRILAMDVDVLAIQEVEDIDILREFNRNRLNGLYPHQILIEGNDARFIDIGLLSKLPVGAATSFQTAVHSQNPGRRVFSRDVVAAEIMNPSGSKVLFTLFNNHLKSHFGDEEGNGQGKADNDTRRRQQAEKLSEIVAQLMRPDGRYIIVGDMNDPPDAAPLQPLLRIEGRTLFNALARPQETRPPKPEADGHDPQSPAWTHRFKPSGRPPEHRLFDQIWLSPALAPAFRAAWIDRRSKHGGDGSDHDPAWVELDL